MTASTQRNTPRVIIVMGVSGCGKSSVAHALAERLSCLFSDADDFHTAEARERMAQGKPLNDELRQPWLRSLAEHLELLYRENKSCVMACSCLKKQYRDQFRDQSFTPVFVFLKGDAKLIAERLGRRQNHFFSGKLLDTQFDTLELPTDEADVVSIDISPPLAQTIDAAHAAVMTHPNLAKDSPV